MFTKAAPTQLMKECGFVLAMCAMRAATDVWGAHSKRAHKSATRNKREHGMFSQPS